MDHEKSNFSLMCGCGTLSDTGCWDRMKSKKVSIGESEINIYYSGYRDLYFDIKPTPGSWHCFWFLLKMVKFWPSFTNTFPMWGKLFQIFLDPNKKKFCFSILKSCMMYDLFLSWYAVEECKKMIRTVQIFISKGTVVKNSHKQKNIWIKNCMIWMKSYMLMLYL